MKGMQLFLNKEIKICNLEKRLKVSTKWIQMLLMVVCFIVVINIIMLSMLLKFP